MVYNKRNNQSIETDWEPTQMLELAKNGIKSYNYCLYLKNEVEIQKIFF